MEDKVKMFLFGRWISTCYADEHMDMNKVYQGEKDFNSQNAMSVLNLEDGYWWAKQLKHFEDVAYPNYVENGSAQKTKEFLSEYKSLTLIKKEPHFAGDYRLEYDGKYVTLFGKDNRYLQFNQEDSYEEMVLIPVVAEIRNAEPEIVKETKTHIVIKL